MNPLAILLTIQNTLPPPPAPTSSPEIDTSRVIGVVILSLGVIVIVALALRPFVARKTKPTMGVGDAVPATEETAMPEQGSSRQIIQFPAPASRAPERADEWTVANPVIEERLGRVIGDSMSRRKLGDRRPNRRAHDLAVAALHRLETDVPSIAENPTSAIAERPIVPIEERRLGAIERNRQGQIVQLQPGSVATSAGAKRVTPRPEAPALVDSPAQAGSKADLIAESDDAVVDTEASASADITEEFVVIRRGQESEHDSAVEASRIANSTYGLNVEGVDVQTLAEISQVLRDLIYCANTGELFHGFALYSDPYLFRFMDGTGLTEEEFREVYGSIGSRPQDAWERLDRLSDVVRNPDGTVVATVSYVDVHGKPTNGRERFRFDFDTDRRVWMIDDIAPLDDLG
jgi:hypothetical protein